MSEWTCCGNWYGYDKSNCPACGWARTSVQEMAKGRTETRTEGEVNTHTEQLRAALVKAVEVIQGWHNMGIPKGNRSYLWDIYWRSAPEMKLIREALKEPK